MQFGQIRFWRHFLGNKSCLANTMATPMFAAALPLLGLLEYACHAAPNSSTMSLLPISVALSMNLSISVLMTRWWCCFRCILTLNDNFVYHFVAGYTNRVLRRVSSSWRFLGNPDLLHFWKRYRIHHNDVSIVCNAWSVFQKSVDRYIQN